MKLIKAILRMASYWHSFEYKDIKGMNWESHFHNSNIMQ